MPGRQGRSHTILHISDIATWSHRTVSRRLNSTLDAQWPIGLYWRVLFCFLWLSYGSLRGSGSVHKCLINDWLIEKRETWICRADCYLQMAPWGRTRREPLSVAQKKKKCKIHQAMLRRHVAALGRIRTSFLNTSLSQCLHLFFSSPQGVPMSDWTTRFPKRLYISSRLRWAWNQFSFIVLFVPLSMLWASGNFFLFQKKSLFAAKEKVWLFVINVVEIQICPPQEGVFINSHSPEN